MCIILPIYTPEYHRLISDNVQLTPHPCFLAIADFLTSINAAALSIKLVPAPLKLCFYWHVLAFNAETYDIIYRQYRTLL